MRRIFVIILGISLLVGCSTIGSTIGGMRESTGNFVKVVDLKLGFSWENGKVVKLDKGSPAERAGVKLGDIFVSFSFNGKKIQGSKEFESLRFTMQPGDHILYVMNRDGEQIELNIKPNEYNGQILPTHFKIARLVMHENKKVTLAVIVGQVKNMAQVSQQWYDAVKIQAQSEYEENMIRGLQNYENFSIVDRSKLKQILDEFQFSRSGFVSDKLRTKIGEMTGATHIIDLSITRFYSTLGKEDKRVNRLIDIESGKVLAVDMGSTYE